MATINFWRDGVKAGTTSKAFDAVIHKELMREHTLAFAVTNNNAVRQFIAPGTIYECEGEKYDIADFVQSSGAENITDTQAYHVSYRLNNYILPPGYSYMGTIQQIAQNILNTAKNGNGTPASSEFTVGACASLGTIAFSLGNEQEVSPRSAFLALQNIGVEVSYSNFTIDLPTRIGIELAHTFKFGVDMVSLRRTWSKNDGTTYEASVAALHRIPGYESLEFALGDTVTIQDDIIGDTFERRIISYDRDPDNPLNDRITLGVFIRDSATNAVQMQVEIDMKLTEGESYNNVAINRKDGFTSTRSDGQATTKMNATDGFIILDKDGKIIGGLRIVDGKVVNVSSALTNPATYTDSGIGTYALIGEDNTSSGYRHGLFMRIDDILFGNETAFAAYHYGVLPVVGDTLFVDCGLSAVYFSLSRFNSGANPFARSFLNASETETTLQFYTANSAARCFLDLSSNGPEFYLGGNKFGRTENIQVSTPTGTRTLTVKNGIIL